MKITRRMLLFSALIAAAGAVATLLIFDPAQCSWLPKCVFFELSGIYCPGCGGTRAVFAFFSGQFFRSLCYFPPLWVAGVIVLRMDILAVLSLATGNPHHASRIRAKSLLWVAVSVLAWFVLRNLLLLCGFDIVLFADGLA